MSATEPTPPPPVLPEWEDSLLSDTPGAGCAGLAAVLAADAALGRAWAADRRIALRLAGLAGRVGTAQRVLAEIRQDRAQPTAQHVIERLRQRHAFTAARRRSARGPRRTAIWLALAASLLFAAGLGALLLRSEAAVDSAPRIWRGGNDTGASLAATGRWTSDTADGSLRWSDASTARLDAGTVVEASATDAFRLVEGAATVSVTPSGGTRTFAIAVPGGRISVVGTAFRLLAGSAATHVEVTSGIVDVIADNGSRVRAAAGDHWTLPVGGSPQRDGLVWSMRPGMPWPPELFFGSAGDSGFASAVYDQDPSRDRLPVVWFKAASGDAVFTWQPGQRVRLRVRLEPGHGDLGVQLYDDLQRRNALATVAIPRATTGWMTVEIPLDQLVYHRAANPIVPGTPIRHLTITGWKDEPPFLISEIAVVGSRKP